MQLTAFMRGYLALVGALEQGRGISQGADFLQPTVEIGDLLGLAQRKFVTVSISQVANVVRDPGIQVPSGRVWRLLNATCNWQTGAVPITGPVYLGLRLPDDLSPATPPMIALGAQALAINTQIVAAFNGDLWLPSGASVCGYSPVATGTMSLTINLVLEEFPG